MSSSFPTKWMITGLVRLSSIKVINSSFTCSEGGLEINPITSVSESLSKSCKAYFVIMPPTFSERSLPPVPMALEIPPPSLSTIVITS